MPEEKVKIDFSSSQPSQPIPIPEHLQQVQEQFIERSETPTEIVELPSRGKLYANTSPLYNMTSIEVNHITALEEDILTTVSLIRSGKAIDMVLRRCIVNKIIKPEDLVNGDRNAIMVHLRASSMGAEYLIDVTCPRCSEITKRYPFDLSKLSMNMFEVEPVTEHSNTFEFLLPVSQKKVWFKFLTAGETKFITDSLDELKKKTKEEVDHTVSTFLKHQVVAVEGNNDRVFVNRFIEKMIARDSIALRTYIRSISPDVIMKQMFSCNFCGEESEVDVPITDEFFWPDTGR